MSYDGTQCKERECPGQSQQRLMALPLLSSGQRSVFEDHALHQGLGGCPSLQHNNYCGVSPICSMIFW
jgi:hypothetical protein